jgi:hypothetical protein
MDNRDRQRRRALFVFQIVVYGGLLAMFLVQLHMLTVRDW